MSEDGTGTRSVSPIAVPVVAGATGVKAVPSALRIYMLAVDVVDSSRKEVPSWLLSALLAIFTFKAVGTFSISMESTYVFRALV